MLRPSKYSHPDRTVIAVSLTLLERLRANRFEDYATLRKYLRKKQSKAEALFIPAINLLFLLGLVEYRAKIDSFEYVGPNETV